MSNVTPAEYVRAFMNRQASWAKRPCDACGGKMWVALLRADDGRALCELCSRAGSDA